MLSKLFTKKTLWVLSIIIIVGLLLDIFIRLRYKANILLFDSNEFNNLVTPITTIIGFIVIIITLRQTKKQLKKSTSDDYYEFYRELFKKIDERDKINILSKEYRLLDFSTFIDNFYTKLTDISEYFTDLNDFKYNNKDIKTRDKPYFGLIMDLYSYKTKAISLYDECLRILQEIVNNQTLSTEHKDFLLEIFITDTINKYISGCKFLKFVENSFSGTLYLTFDKSDTWMMKNLDFFDDKFFELFFFIMRENKLENYFERVPEV